MSNIVRLSGIWVSAKSSESIREVMLQSTTSYKSFGATNNSETSASE
jgi:hypothetical protein